MYSVPSADAARSLHINDGVLMIIEVPRVRKLEPLLRLHVEVGAAESAARDVVGRRGDGARNSRVAREARGARLHAVQRHGVLLGAKSEDGEAVGRAVDAGNEQHARERRGHRCEVTLKLRRQVRGCDVALRAADIGRLLVAVDALLHRLDAWRSCRAESTFRRASATSTSSSARRLTSNWRKR